MFDKPDKAPDSAESLGPFLRGIGFVCYLAAAACLALAVWDAVEIFDLQGGDGTWVRHFRFRPMWVMALLTLLFFIVGSGFVRTGSWIKRHFLPGGTPVAVATKEVRPGPERPGDARPRA